MRYLKYFESHSNDFYTKFGFRYVDQVLFDDWMDITDVSIPFSDSEVEKITHYFKSFEFIKKYTNLHSKISTKKRGQLTDNRVDNFNDLVQVCVRFCVNDSPDDLILMIYKTIDEWYYVATYGGDGDYRCDQMQGLLKFFEDLPKMSPETFEKSEKTYESVNTISMREKLESIVSMCNYLWSINAADSLRGFYGRCSVLFTGCLHVNSDWSKSGLKPYEFNIDCLIHELETSEYRREEKIKLIEDLYKLSKNKKFRYTKEDVEKILAPVLDFKILGNSPIDKIEISQFYDWLSKPSFSIKFYINEEELSYDKDDVKNSYDNQYDNKESKDILRSVQKEFRHIRQIITRLVEKIDLKSLGLKIESSGDYTHLGEVGYFSLHLKEE